MTLHERDFNAALIAYRERIATLHTELGVPKNYEQERGMPLVFEAQELQSIGEDRYQRERHLSPAAANAWREMVGAAAADGVTIDLISAFRSVDYQTDLIRRKLSQGQPIEQILAVLAAPGFSEHHSGRAVDVGSPGQDACVEEFESTAAFQWLQKNAARYHFALSYPRENPHKIVYEPWHWAHQPSA